MTEDIERDSNGVPMFVQKLSKKDQKEYHDIVKGLAACTAPGTRYQSFPHWYAKIVNFCESRKLPVADYKVR